jgi:hypothetical protein
MLTRLLKFLSDFRDDTRDLRCKLGFHRWVAGPDLIFICDREPCRRAKKMLRGGKLHYFDREEITEDQFKKLNRQERRRLGAMARRGLFGKIN